VTRRPSPSRRATHLFTKALAHTAGVTDDALIVTMTAESLAGLWASVPASTSTPSGDFGNGAYASSPCSAGPISRSALCPSTATVLRLPGGSSNGLWLSPNGFTWFWCLRLSRWGPFRSHSSVHNRGSGERAVAGVRPCILRPGGRRPPNSMVVSSTDKNRRKALSCPQGAVVHSAPLQVFQPGFPCRRLDIGGRRQAM
jgi:hypothetical protein